MSDVIFYKLDCTETSGMSRSQIYARIAQIQAIVSSLLTTAMTSVMSGNIIEYELDTGQTKTRTIYSKTSEITATVMEYEKLIQYYQNKLVSRNVRLVDSKNFKNRC